MGIVNTIRNKGLIFCIQKGILRLLGIDKKIDRQQDAINAVFYYLNNYVITDLTVLPPTNDQYLRIMQKCDVALLLILDKICNKYHIDYWLDFGTLLGAVRHNGFIPWDDDMDVACLSKDYYKLLDALRNELSDDDFDIEDDKDNLMGRIGFGYKHKTTGIWIDICPIDEYRANHVDNLYKELNDKRNKWRKYYLKHRSKCSIEQLVEKKNIFFDNKNDCKHIYYHHGCEFLHQHPVICEKNIIYPLKKHEFDGAYFNVPYNYNKYLTLMYGNNYMKLPQSGILHHGLGRGDLSTWAAKNNVNMYDVYEKLVNIANNI